MNIPGFTAESAIGGSRGNYEMKSVNGLHLSGASVIPQTVDCWTRCEDVCGGLPKPLLGQCFTRCVNYCRETGKVF
jgi:hypothetical protein